MERQVNNITDIKWQPGTHRVKTVLFNGVSTSDDIVHAEDASRRLVDEKLATDKNIAYLMQIRFILAQKDEKKLLQRMEETNCPRVDENTRVAVRIPFSFRNHDLALYYLHIESKDRQGYVDQKLGYVPHREAVLKGLEKRQNFKNNPLSEDFGIEVVSYATNQYWRQEGTALVPTKEPFFEEEEITEEIIRVHSNAFAYAHDSSQRERGGILSIIEHNPTVVAYHKENRELAALGYLEKDDRFSFNNLNLVEPTYFTDPKYEKNGLSMHLRKATQRLLDMSNQIDVYNNQPVIVFNESIRITSFPLALQSGCELGGEIDTSITGDLGDAYTYIGPANPQTGLMPLGVTYYTDPRIRSKIV